MSKHVYVAGPMRGIPGFNFPAFFSATEHLRSLGYTVFNPAERDVNKHGWQKFQRHDGDHAKVQGFDLRDALRADVNWIAQYADAVATLPGWGDSKGATAEVALARALGLTVQPVEQFEAVEEAVLASE